MTKREIAKQSGLSRPTIDKRLKKGETVEQILTTEPTPAPTRAAKKSETFIDAQTRKERALADLRELELAVKSGDLAPVAEVNAWVAGQILRARDILVRIAPELRDRLAQETNPNRVQELIDAEVNRALTALAEYRHA
jgi:hypothetical protein